MYFVKSVPEITIFYSDRERHHQWYLSKFILGVNDGEPKGVKRYSHPLVFFIGGGAPPLGSTPLPMVSIW